MSNTLRTGFTTGTCAAAADIIIVDDNSNDDTKAENHLVDDKIGAVVAEGIRYIQSLNKNYDYILLLGSMTYFLLHIWSACH